MFFLTHLTAAVRYPPPEHNFVALMTMNEIDPKV